MYTLLQYLSSCILQNVLQLIRPRFFCGWWLWAPFCAHPIGRLVVLERLPLSMRSYSRCACFFSFWRGVHSSSNAFILFLTCWFAFLFFWKDGNEAALVNAQAAGGSGVVDISTLSAILFVVVASFFLILLYKLMSYWFVELLVVLFCIGGVEVCISLLCLSFFPSFLHLFVFFTFYPFYAIKFLSC